MKKFQAVDKAGSGLVTVLASNRNGAKTEVQRQLGKRGRQGALARWLKGGKKLKTE